MDISFNLRDEIKLEIFNKVAKEKTKNKYINSNFMPFDLPYRDILDKIPTEEIENYLRERKLQKIKSKM